MENDGNGVELKKDKIKMRSKMVVMMRRTKRTVLMMIVMMTRKRTVMMMFLFLKSFGNEIQFEYLSYN